jgi:hypothetical protein
MAIYDQKCKLSKRTNRQISLALYISGEINHKIKLRLATDRTRNQFHKSELIKFINYLMYSFVKQPDLSKGARDDGAAVIQCHLGAVVHLVAVVCAVVDESYRSRQSPMAACF